MLFGATAAADAVADPGGPTARLQRELPGLVFSAHAAAEWAGQPALLQRCLDHIAAGFDFNILNQFRDDHVKAPEEWTPIPGALEAVARLNHAGWHVVLATNQSGIGRGMIDMAAVNAVHAHMMRSLQALGGRIDAVFFCPHTPEDGCDCRKPLPGALLQAARDHDIDLAASHMVGDRWRDVLAGQAAGCRTYFVDYAYVEPQPQQADHRVASLAQAADIILEKS